MKIYQEDGKTQEPEDLESLGSLDDVVEDPDVKVNIIAVFLRLYHRGVELEKK